MPQLLLCRLLALDDASIYLEDVKYGSIDTVVDLDFSEQGSHAAHFEVRDGRDSLVLHKNSTARWFHSDEYNSPSWRDNGVFEFKSVSEVHKSSEGQPSSQPSFQPTYLPSNHSSERKNILYLL